MDDIGGVVGALLVVAIVFYVLSALVSIIASAVIVIVAIVGIFGTAVGFYSAIKHFYTGIQEAYENFLVPYKDETTELQMLEAAQKGDFSGFEYETTAKKSFFCGPCYTFIRNVFVYSFKNIGKEKPNFENREAWWQTVVIVIEEIFRIISSYVISSILILVLSIILSVIFLVITLFAHIVMAIILLIHKVIFKIKHISFICSKCKKEYKLPYYRCPVCNIIHINLRPGYWGLERRKCLCGTMLPTTTYSVGGTKNNKIYLKNINGYCPFCGNNNNSGLTRQISIALIGGTSAGKSTFQTAFLRDFVDEETVRCNIDYDFPNEDMEAKFNEYEKEYMGRRPIASTQPGMYSDITAFSLLLNQKKLLVERTMHIYDMPGEVFLKGDAKEGNQIYSIENGIVFILDPYSIDSVRSENEIDVTGNTMGICVINMNDLVQALIDTMSSVKIKTIGGKYILPIAVTINKVDTPTLKKQTGESAVDSLMKKYPDIFTDRYLTMDYVCRCFLVSKGGRGFINVLDDNFNTVHYFFSSPMGYVPRGTLSRFKPINVMDIMRWIILRADKQFEKVWTGGEPVRDLTDKEKKMYLTHEQYYREYINKIDFL